MNGAQVDDLSIRMRSILKIPRQHAMKTIAAVSLTGLTAQREYPEAQASKAVYAWHPGQWN